MLKHLIRSRLYSAKPGEIVKYGRKYGITITTDQAEHLINFIKKEKIDPFSDVDRSKTFRYIEQTVGKKEAKQLDELLHTLARKYKVDHLL